MKIQFEQNERKVSFFFSLGDGEGGSNSRGVSLAKNECFFQLPPSCNTSRLHPDLIGLCALMLVNPFVKTKITLNIPVSNYFASFVSENFNLEFTNVDSSLERKPVNDSGVPALAFSAGVDSFAALLSMPDNVKPVFMNMAIPNGHKSMYSAESAKHAISHLRSEGRAVETLDSDMEFIRKPIGFPTDVSNAIPAILTSEHFNINSIAYGTILESAYRVGGSGLYVDYVGRQHYKQWFKGFEIAGLPMNWPVAGLSEVGTSKLLANSEYRNLAQSCIRGTAMSPCRNCWKCFRKRLLETALLKGKVTDEDLVGLIEIPEAQKHLLKMPIKHQNVIEYIVSKYEGSNISMNLLAEKVGVHDCDFLEKWYSPAEELTFAPYRELTRSFMSKSLGVMTKSEEEKLEAYKIPDNFSILKKEVNEKLKNSFPAKPSVEPQTLNAPNLGKRVVRKLIRTIRQVF